VAYFFWATLYTCGERTTYGITANA